MIEPIKNLDILIRNMEPIRGSDYAFCQIDEPTYRTTPVVPLAMFREEEGITVIYPVTEADNLRFPVAWVGTLITLNVNSSLDAVGFLARITNQLASANISVNAFSPISHDHLFVKPEDADRTMEILHKMTQDV
jgi:hypothetical protein